MNLKQLSVTEGDTDRGLEKVSSFTATEADGNGRWVSME